LSLEERYTVYKQKQAKEENDARLETKAREVLKLEQAHEWLHQALTEHFPTEKFQRHDVIAITDTHERIGPMYSLQFRGLGLYFYSKEKGSLSVYTPVLGSGGCKFVTSFGENFTTEDFFRAIDRNFGEPL